VGPYKFIMESSIEEAVYVDNTTTSLITRTASMWSNREASIYFSQVKLRREVRRGDPLFTIYFSNKTCLYATVKLDGNCIIHVIKGMLIKASLDLKTWC